MNVYLLAADAILVTHTLFVAFVVGGLLLIAAGGVLGWPWVRNPWFRLLHLLAIVFVTLQAWAGEICPLTTWEMELRSRGGQATYDSSFIAYWLGRLIYYEAPPWVFVVIYTLFAALVVATLFWVKPRRFGRLDEGT